MVGHRAERIEARLYALALLAVIMAVGVWLRAVYLGTISLHVDEFISMLAIRGVLEHGYPLLPSGTLYEQGLVFSYAEAALMRLFGFEAGVGRMFSLALSAATLAVTYYVGSRMFSRRVGLLGAALLAEWRKRSRLVHYRGLQADRPGRLYVDSDRAVAHFSPLSIAGNIISPALVDGGKSG